MNEVLSVHNISYAYPQKSLFTDFSINIEKGDWLVFIGSNGAGKSTLLRLMAGRLALQSGSIMMKEGLRSAYVGQHEFSEHNRFPATALEIVLSAYTKELGFFKYPSKIQKEKAKELLKELGLEKEMYTRLSELSGGQRQRVFIAKALLAEIDILFLDEPTSALDPKFSLDLLKRLVNFQQNGLTIIMVTHDLALAQMVTQKIMCVGDHDVLALDPTSIAEELAHRHQHIGVSHV